MNDTLAIIGMTCMGLGLAFDLFGCLGLVRLPDVYNRLQASTKCVTLGTCGVLLGAFLLTGVSAIGLKSLLCIGFLVLTAPVSAHAIARGAHRAGIPLSDTTVVDAYAEDRKGDGAPKESQSAQPAGSES